jgi:hypothetical protein
MYNCLNDGLTKTPVPLQDNYSVAATDFVSRNSELILSLQLIFRYKGYQNMHDFQEVLKFLFADYRPHDGMH